MLFSWKHWKHTSRFLVTEIYPLGVPSRAASEERETIRICLGTRCYWALTIPVGYGVRRCHATGIDNWSQVKGMGRASYILLREPRLHPDQVILFGHSPPLFRIGCTRLEPVIAPVLSPQSDSKLAHLLALYVLSSYVCHQPQNSDITVSSHLDYCRLLRLHEMGHHLL